MAWNAPLIYSWEVPKGGDIARRAEEGHAIDEVVGPDSNLTASKNVVSGHHARVLLDLAEETDTAITALRYSRSFQTHQGSQGGVTSSTPLSTSTVRDHVEWR